MCVADVVMDWASRTVFASSVASTLEACPAVDVRHEACTRHGTPEIVQTDQGSQFTAQAFMQAVKDRGGHRSMDGRGVWRDPGCVERRWKSVNDERVSLHASDSVTEARQSILHYGDWDNRARPQSSVARQPPDEASAVMLPTGKRAAYVAAETSLKTSGCCADEWGHFCFPSNEQMLSSVGGNCSRLAITSSGCRPWSR